jgi:hypothetical protein
MAHFAKIENNIVTQVIVIGNDDCVNQHLASPILKVLVVRLLPTH